MSIVGLDPLSVFATSPPGKQKGRTRLLGRTSDADRQGHDLDFLRQRGQTGEADQASQELPQQVDTEQDAGLLKRFGVNPEDLESGSLWEETPGLGS